MDSKVRRWGFTPFQKIHWVYHIKFGYFKEARKNRDKKTHWYLYQIFEIKSIDLAWKSWKNLVFGVIQLFELGKSNFSFKDKINTGYSWFKENFNN